MSALTLAAFLLGQAAPATAPGTEVRALTVTLLGEKDEAATDVSAADVALQENGVTRDITSWKPDTRPLSVAVVVDSSLAVGPSYRMHFVDAVLGLLRALPEGARYVLWTTGDRPTKVVDHTDDRQAATAALRRVAPQGGNYMLDAISEASSDLAKLSREGDRKVMVAVTGTGQELSYVDKYRSAEDGEKSLDLFLGLEVDDGAASFEERSNLNYVFDRLARATGGRQEITLAAMGTGNELRTLAAHIRAGYRLAYATVPDLKKRKLDLSVARPGTRVFLPAESDREPAAGERQAPEAP